MKNENPTPKEGKISKLRVSGGGRIQYGGKGETKRKTTPFALTSRWRWACDGSAGIRWLNGTLYAGLFMGRAYKCGPGRLIGPGLTLCSHCGGLFLGRAGLTNWAGLDSGNYL